MGRGEGTAERGRSSSNVWAPWAKAQRMSRLRRILIGGVLAVLALAVAVVVARLPGCTMMGFGTWSLPEDPELSSPELSVPEEPKAEMRRVVVKGLRCRLDGAEPSECEDVCKVIEKSSGSATLDADAGSHKVVEELRRCLEEAGVEIRWGS